MHISTYRHNLSIRTNGNKRRRKERRMRMIRTVVVVLGPKEWHKAEHLLLPPLNAKELPAPSPDMIYFVSVGVVMVVVGTCTRSKEPKV